MTPSLVPDCCLERTAAGCSLKTSEFSLKYGIDFSRLTFWKGFQYLCVLEKVRKQRYFTDIQVELVQPGRCRGVSAAPAALPPWAEVSPDLRVRRRGCVHGGTEGGRAGAVAHPEHPLAPLAAAPGLLPPPACVPPGSDSPRANQPPGGTPWPGSPGAVAPGGRWKV